MTLNVLQSPFPEDPAEIPIKRFIEKPDQFIESDRRSRTRSESETLVALFEEIVQAISELAWVLGQQAQQ